MTRREHIPFLFPLAIFAGLLGAFGTTLDAREDFMMCLVLTELAAWLVSYRLAVGMVKKMGKRPGWIRAAWFTSLAVLLIFPLGTLAFGAASELCAVYRGWIGQPRPLAANFFFRDFSGLRLGNGLREGWRNVGFATAAGLASAFFWAPPLFALAACCKRWIEAGGDRSRATSR